MKYAALALVFGLLLVMPLVRADYCLNPTTKAYNITYNVSGIQIPVEVTQPCDFGCDAPRGVCMNAQGTPIEIYLLFEIIAFISLVGSFWSAKSHSEITLVFPIFSCVMFFILGFLGGTIIINGNFVVSMLAIWMNYALAMLSLVLVFFNLILEFGKTTGTERQKGPEYP